MRLKCVRKRHSLNAIGTLLEYERDERGTNDCSLFDFVCSCVSACSTTEMKREIDENKRKKKRVLKMTDKWYAREYNSSSN